MSRSVGCGAAGAALVPAFSRSTPITPRSSSSAWRAVARSRAAVSRTCVRRQVRTHLEPAGVQRHQGDPVGEHVVHLARDPGPLGHPRLLLVQLLIGLGPQGPLAQRQQQLASGPDEHAPRGGGERQRHDQQHHRERDRSSGCRRRRRGRTGSTARRPARWAGPGDARPGTTARGARRGSRRSRSSRARDTRARRRPAIGAATTARGRPATPAATSTAIWVVDSGSGLSCSSGLRKSAPRTTASRNASASTARSRPAWLRRQIRQGQVVGRRRRPRQRGPRPARQGHDLTVDLHRRGGHRRKSRLSRRKAVPGPRICRLSAPRRSRLADVRQPARAASVGRPHHRSLQGASP